MVTIHKVVKRLSPSGDTDSHFAGIFDSACHDRCRHHIGACGMVLQAGPTSAIKERVRVSGSGSGLRD